MSIFTPTVEPMPIAADAEAVVDHPDGLPPHVLVIYHLGLPYPVGDQIAVMHVGDVRLAMGKEDAKQHAEKIIEKAEGLPKVSSIPTASSMAEAERLAKDLRKFEGDQQNGGTVT